MNLQLLLLKLAIKPVKKSLKKWLSERALRMPHARVLELSTRLNVPVADIETINQAGINDVLNLIEAEL